MARGQVRWTVAGENGDAKAPAADGDAPPEGKAAGGQAPQAGDGQAPPSNAQQTGNSGGEGAEAKAARLEQENAALRRENAERRKRATELEQAGMTEAEREKARATAAEEDNTRLREQLRAQALSAAAASAAAKLGYRSPELAVRLLDRSAIQWVDDEPKGVEAQLRELAKVETYLTKGADGDYGGGNRGTAPSGKPSMNELLHAALRQD